MLVHDSYVQSLDTLLPLTVSPPAYCATGEKEVRQARLERGVRLQ